MIIDPSALLAVLLHEPERSAIIRATGGAVLVAPGSMPWEVGNALVAGVRRKRFSVEAVPALWASFEQVPIRLVAVDQASALQLAFAHGLYAYDAYVLEAARAGGLPLLALDLTLRRAATAAGLELVELE